MKERIEIISFYAKEGERFAIRKSTYLSRLFGTSKYMNLDNARRHCQCVWYSAEFEIASRNRGALEAYSSTSLQFVKDTLENYRPGFTIISE